MSTDKRVSNLIEQQFPDFVRDDGPNLVAFVKAYYEWAEQANNFIEVSKNLLEYQDIDNTYDKYLEYFHREIMNSFPRSMLVNKKLFAKHVKDLYRSRGSELSYRLLFRVLFNEEIDFYYPGNDILRASDGRWVEESVIRVSKPRTVEASEFVGQTIEGLNSGAIATVDKTLDTISAGEIVNELFLLNIVGTFEDNEKVALQSNTSAFGTIISISGPLQSVNLIQGGVNHQPNDLLSFTSASGSGARGQVISTADTSAVQWSIANGGFGYTNNATITISGVGTGAQFIINSIKDTEVIAVPDDIIQPILNVVINTGPTFVSAGANTSVVSANLAAANVGTVINTALHKTNTTVGTIDVITTTVYGSGYDTLPTANVFEKQIADMFIPNGFGGFKGVDASINASYRAGTIVTLKVTQNGTNYNKYDVVTIANLSRDDTEDASGSPNVSGNINLTGKYIDTKGFLSWNNKLQDNYYYQEFSYEIGSSKFIKAYRKLVKSILHPTGTKMFGRVNIINEVDSSNTSNIIFDSLTTA